MRVAETSGRASCANCRFCDKHASKLLGRPARPDRWRCTFANLAPTDFDPLTGARTVRPVYDYCSTRNSAGECEDWESEGRGTLVDLMRPMPVGPRPMHVTVLESSLTCKCSSRPAPVAPPSPHVFIGAC